MHKFCQNPFCEVEAVEEVNVSVRTPSDETRSVCACCEEVYIWGVQHGKKISTKSKQWILAIADKGIITYVMVYSTKKQAEHGLVNYLRNAENYDGPDEFSEALSWVARHDDRMSVEIIEVESGSNDDTVDHDVPPNIDRFLAEGGFIVLGLNQHDSCPDRPFEAWAYQGCLDFGSAKPVTFSLGPTLIAALNSLDAQLGQIQPQVSCNKSPITYKITPPPRGTEVEPL